MMFVLDILLRIWIASMLTYIGIMIWRQADE